MVAVARLAALALCGIIFLLTFDSSAAMTATSKPSECEALRNFRKTTLDSVHGGEQFKKKDVVRTGGQGLETTVGALIVNEEFKIAFCPIQKVASSEWGKFFNRLTGDRNYRMESYKHQKYEKANKGLISRGSSHPKDPHALEHLNENIRDPDWTFGIFLRDPLKRLQSIYLMLFHSERGKKVQHSEGKGKGDYGYHKYREKFNLAIGENISFAQFVDRVTDPVNPAKNIHWRPQSHFCGARHYLDLFNFVGNLEDVSRKAEIFFKCTNTWEAFGSNGWGPHANASMFAKGGSLSAPHATKSANHTSLATITPDIREKVRQFYHEDYEMNEKIRSPVYDSTIWE